MNTAAPQARAKAVALTPAGHRGTSHCDCAEGEAAAAGLPRFLARHGASGPGCGVQPKLRIGRQDDPFEREADAVADAVVRNQAVNVPGLPAASGAAGASSASGAPGAFTVSGETPGRPEALRGMRRRSRHVARRRARATQRHGQRGRHGGRSARRRALPHAPDAGSPLQAGVRTRLESSLGADLGDVRVHAGPAADGMAKALNAKAFTHGEHIWLGPQQRGGRPAADGARGRARDAAGQRPRLSGGGAARAQPTTAIRRTAAAVLSRMQGRSARPARATRTSSRPVTRRRVRHTARSAAGGVDRGELAQERGKLEPAGQPSGPAGVGGT